MRKALWILVIVLGSGVMIAAVIGALTEDEGDPIGLGLLPVPAIGVTELSELYDGHPVFVTHDLDGTISVLHMTSPGLAADQMGWCEPSRTIDDIPRGARWDVQGRYVSGPAPTDLDSYEYVIDQRTRMIVVLMSVIAKERTASPLDTVTHWCADHGGYETHSGRSG